MQVTIEFTQEVKYAVSLEMTEEEYESYKELEGETINGKREIFHELTGFASCSDIIDAADSIEILNVTL